MKKYEIFIFRFQTDILFYFFIFGLNIKLEFIFGEWLNIYKYDCLILILKSKLEIKFFEKLLRIFNQM